MPNPVIVYSTPTCGYCRVVKELLTRRGVPYTEQNAEDPGVLDDLETRAGQQIQTVPVLEAGGKFLVGYDPKGTLVFLRQNGYTI
jgi:glutaredoxin 3